VLGSGKLGAPEWSQSRNTVDISQAAEVQSCVELGSLAGAAMHPFASSRKWRKGPRLVEPFFCHVDHGPSPACEWSEVARPRAARQERSCRTMHSF